MQAVLVDEIGQSQTHQVDHHCRADVVRYQQDRQIRMVLAHRRQPVAEDPVRYLNVGQYHVPTMVHHAE